VFGCWTSVSRGSMLPVFEELNNILFYPVQYEGKESSKSIFPPARRRTAGDPGIRLADERRKRAALGAARHRLRLSRHHQRRILDASVKQKGVAAEDIMASHMPFGHSDWRSIVAQVKRFGSAGKKTAVVSTINGDANVPFDKELANQGIKATDIPVVAFSVGEEELAGIDRGPLVRHLAAWNDFMSLDTPIDEEFIRTWHAFLRNPRRVTNDPMEAHFIVFNMWVEAVKKAGTTVADPVIDALIGVAVPNLTGGISTMMPNHHITMPVLIGEVQADGQSNTVWQTAGTVVGDVWSDDLEGSKDLIAEWRAPMKCANLNPRTGRCGGS